MKKSIYKGVSESDYQTELKRLQLQLLKIQKRVIKEGKRIVVVFEGRDAAGKGATIKRFMQHLNPQHASVVELGVPTQKEMALWFKRYEKLMPQKGQIIFFDRSWYSRALVQPVMGYCDSETYEAFMRDVNAFENRLMFQGITIIKIYLSIDKETQKARFEARLDSHLTEWKFSENDLNSREKWDEMTSHEKRMFKECKQKGAVWKQIDANVRREAVLTSMLHVVNKLSRNFKPLTGEDVTQTYSIKIAGVKFRGLSAKQYAVLKEVKENEHRFVEL